MTQHTLPIPSKCLTALRPRQPGVHRAQRGVTLVEVLIVVAIMAMLAGGVAFAILPRMQETRIKTARQGAKQLVAMVESWRLENADGCPTVSQLKKDKYLSKTASSEDPWGTTFEIRCEGDDIHVRSAGPDKQSGTKDDIEEPKSGDDEEG